MPTGVGDPDYAARDVGLAGCLTLAACGNGETPSGNAMTTASGDPVKYRPVAPPAALETDGWIGRWVGVEGLALQVSAGKRTGRYRLHVQSMDGAGDYGGAADGTMIRFTRAGVPETLRHTTGAETGLKWLAGKRDCLTVRPGEGFCRD